MSDVISISFTPSREYADETNRQRRILRERSFGATASDTYHLGLKDYDEVDPYARYRDDERKPITVPAWRERIEKAKRDIEKHRSEQRVQLLAESIPDETILSEIEVIRTWARSLKQINPQSRTGSRESTRAGTN
jgi:PAS domain-containing protein